MRETHYRLAGTIIAVASVHLFLLVLTAAYRDWRIVAVWAVWMAVCLIAWNVYERKA